MARQRASQKVLGFPKGLNTETSLLNPEEGTTADELNMDLRLNKLIRARRLGLENVGTAQATSGDIIGGYYWESTDSFVLVGLRDDDPETYDTVTLYFYDGDLNYESEYTVRVLDGAGTYPNFSDIRNRLVITFGAKPFVFSKQSSGCLDGWYLDLFFRDFKLVDDSLAIAERPATLSDEHKYNIFNAGWHQEVYLENETIGRPEEDFFSRFAQYPSNADVLAFGLSALTSSGITYFNADELKTPRTGNTEAPRGHYVFNIREIDRQDRADNRDTDGVPTSTLTKVVDCNTNISGLGGNLIYQDTAPTGTSTDGSGGGSGGVTDPSLPPGGGFWDPE